MMVLPAKASGSRLCRRRHAEGAAPAAAARPAYHPNRGGRPIASFAHRAGGNAWGSDVRPRAQPGMDALACFAAGQCRRDASAVASLDHVVIRSPNPERAIALYAGRLGLSLRLDRTEPKWGARLLFFRCGDLIVEVAHNLEAGVGDGPDRLFGLSWRVPDVTRAHARLRAGGVDVSDIRAGRRPHTQGLHGEEPHRRRADADDRPGAPPKCPAAASTGSQVRDSAIRHLGPVANGAAQRLSLITAHPLLLVSLTLWLSPFTVTEIVPEMS